MGLHVIILAAGKGTRMRSNLPKVLHCVSGKPMIKRVVDAAQVLDPEKIHIVFSDQQLLEHLPLPDINWVEQKEQLGTGHAVLQTLPYIPDDARVLILCGDVPLITATTLNNFLNDTDADSVGVITVFLKNPYGFGRIVRDTNGFIQEIIEQKDANDEVRNIKEINSGIISISAEKLKRYLPKIETLNSQAEYYLTDVIKMAAEDNNAVIGFIVDTPEEVAGVNDREQLANLERYQQQKIAQNLMCAGVTLMDPARLDVRGDAQIANDVIIDVNVIFEGKVVIETGTNIAANNILKNTRIGKNVTINANCVIEDAVIDDGCVIGPFARIRPGSRIASGAHIGNFVEVKNTKIGEGSKANHLSYLGDSVIGKRVNIGAGTITCNYDGANKYQTIIEDDVFVGSDVQFIAPVRIGKGATIGAGSTIAQDVAADKLTVCRAKNQITFDNWQRPLKKK